MIVQLAELGNRVVCVGGESVEVALHEHDDRFQFLRKVRRRLHGAEADGVINVVRSLHRDVAVQHDAPVAGLSGLVHESLDEAPPDAEAAEWRANIEALQLARAGAMRLESHAAHRESIVRSE